MNTFRMIDGSETFAYGVIFPNGKCVVWKILEGCWYAWDKYVDMQIEYGKPDTKYYMNEHCHNPECNHDIDYPNVLCTNIFLCNDKKAGIGFKKESLSLES